MTETEWQTSGVPRDMFAHCWPSASARKKRLFSCACCSRTAHLLNAAGHAAVAAAEAFADGDITAGELAAARRDVRSGPSVLCYFLCSPDLDDTQYDPQWVWRGAAERLLAAGAKWHPQLDATCALFRDIFGNPFRPVALDPAWRTSDVLAIAAQTYEARDFGAMPILADALQDAGCDHADILAHCRSDEAHVRGCWVVDLLLGKA